jgi:exopolysaccharide production protein ExoZ
MEIGHSKSRVYVNIQILRFVSAALVVFAHCIDLSLEGSGRSFFVGTSMENFGAVGVDIFFVISGFIIATNIKSTSVDARRFSMNRLVRVVPIYWIYSLPSIIMALQNKAPIGVLISTFLFWPCAGQTIADPALSVGWTLNFEMLFYFAATLYILFQRSAASLFVLLFAFLVFVVLGQFTATPVFTFLGNPIIFEFLFGVLLAQCVQWIRPGLAVLCGLIALILFSLWLVQGFGAISEAEFTTDGSLSLQRMIIWGVPAALLVACAIGTETARTKSFLTRWLAHLGDASYSIYLTHLGALFLLKRLVETFALDANLIVLCGFVFSVAAGALAYSFVETPILARLRSLALFRQPNAAPPPTA